MPSPSLLKLLAKADKLQGIKLKAHVAVNRVYRNVTQEYQDWRGAQGDGFVRQQLEALDYVCPVCGDDLSLRAATVDHLLPKRRYLHKTLDEGNFLVMCYPCNKDKAARAFPEWRQSLPPLQRQSLDYAIALLHGSAKVEQLIAETWK